MKAFVLPAPSAMFLMNQGRPRENKTAKELAPRALDTPIPPFPERATITAEIASYK